MELTNVSKLFDNKLKRAYAVSFAFLGVFAYLLLVRNDLGKLSELQGSFNEVRGNLHILKTIAEDKTYVNEFDAKAAVNKDINALIEIITAIAKEKSIAIILVKPIGTNIVSGYKKISVLVEGKAPYYNVADFVSGVENSGQYLFIEEFELRGEDIAPARETGRRRERQKFSPGPFTEEIFSSDAMRKTFSGGENERPFRTERMAIFKMSVTCLGADE